MENGVRGEGRAKVPKEYPCYSKESDPFWRQLEVAEEKGSPQQQWERLSRGADHTPNAGPFGSPPGWVK